MTLPSSPYRKRQKGLTLLELLVALGIVAFALAAFSFKLGGTRDRLSLERTTQQAAAMLREARAGAIRRNTAQSVVIQLEEKSFLASLYSNATPYTDDISLEATAAQELLTENGDPVFWFWPDGSASGGEIKLSRDDVSFTIKIDWLTGTIEVNQEL